MINFTYDLIRNIVYRHRLLQIGLTNDGKWIVFTSTNPYFFVSDTSEEEVVKKAKESVDFWFEQQLPPDRHHCDKHTD